MTHSHPDERAVSAVVWRAVSPVAWRDKLARSATRMGCSRFRKARLPDYATGVWSDAKQPQDTPLRPAAPAVPRLSTSWAGAHPAGAKISRGTLGCGGLRCRSSNRSRWRLLRAQTRRTASPSHRPSTRAPRTPSARTRGHLKEPGTPEPRSHGAHFLSSRRQFHRVSTRRASSRRRFASRPSRRPRPCRRRP